jgi:hypothetical protein
VFDGQGDLTVESSAYCPEFGRSIDCKSLVLTTSGRDAASGFCIAHGDGAVDYALATGATAHGRRYSW